MKRLIVVAVALLIFAGITLGCGKPYVGKSVNYSWDGWCQYAEYYNYGNKHCTIKSGALVFDFDISKGENEREYIIDGYIDPTQGEIKSWGHMLDTGTSFNMILAHAGYVVDNISFRPRTATGDLGRKIPFHIEFAEPKGFDAVTFKWKMRMRG